MNELFRPEAHAAQHREWLAPVQLRHAPSIFWLTGGVVLVAASVAAFVGLASYTRKESLVGQLVPSAGIVRLAAPQSGLIVEQHASEGAAVRQGDLLFVLRPPHGALLDGAQSEVSRSLLERQQALEGAARLQQQLTRARLSALQQRLDALRVEGAQLDGELAAQQQRVALAKASLERQRALQAQQFISPAQVQAREEEVLALQALTQALRRQRAALDRERADLEGERSTLPLQGAQAQSTISRDLAHLARERAEQDPERQFSVRAPQDGVISALLAHQGQSVVEGSPLASLVPGRSPLVVQLLAPTSSVGFIKPGQTVRVRYDAYPFQRFGQQRATVIQVSPLPLSAADVAALPLPPGSLPTGAEPLYRVTAHLEEDPGAEMPQPLRPGMRLMADVLLDKRRLYEWMFAPALGVAGRL